jgi:beta-lactamase regulating signal transducer with metallopeptidase domain/uncharacterized GH25 family protein
MNFPWLASPEWATVVQALLHTLWQGAIIAVALGLALRRLRQPGARYRCALAALAAVLLAGIVTWAFLNRPVAPPASHTPPPAASAVSLPLAEHTPPGQIATVPISETQPAMPATPGWTAWLALFWLAGATLMIGRAGAQVAGAERLRRSAQPLADARLAELLAAAQRAVGLTRRVRLAVTDQLTSPAVVGVLVPTLVLPLSLTTTLAPEQIRYILLHELAHIRRGDYFANLFQLLVEALLFFNPAVWWVSRQVRLEREACCDALAIGLSGEPADYARTLVRVAETVLDPTPVAAPAFGDRREPSSLADRVQRLLVPGYRPRLRLTWRAMLASLFVGGALLTLSALGTRVAVAAILSPEQRIERIEKKMAEYGDASGINLMPEQAEQAPKVEVSGWVRTADGSPLPKHFWLQMVSVVKYFSSGSYADVKSNGKFKFTICPGQIILAAEIPGYAPAQIGPLLCIGTNKLENLELVFTRGFTAPIQLVEAGTGKPLAGAKVQARFWMRGASQTSFPEVQLLTDAQGMAMVTNAADLPLVIKINTPGYEVLEKRFEILEAGKPLRIQLQPGKTIAGVVVDKTTGKPLAGAAVRMRFEDGPTRQSYAWDDPMRVLATTDNQGRFITSQLRADTVYWLGVSAPGHESVQLQKVRGGNESLEACLGPELIVKGRITGNLDLLENSWWNGEYGKTISYTFDDVIADQRCQYTERAAVNIVNGNGYFQFTNRVARRVQVEAPGQVEERFVSAPIDDWAIDLKGTSKMEAKDLPNREVIFRFKSPSGALPRGTVKIEIPDKLDRKHLTSHYQEMEITNGEVHAKIAVGGRTAIEPERMVGYWFNRAGSWKSPTGESGDWLFIEVRSNSSPLVIDIPLIPAGAIYAKARNSDGTPAGGLFFGVTELKRAPGRDQNSFDSASDSLDGNAPRKWVSGPLPLGGTYQIYGWRGKAFCISKPITLTEAEPDAEVELQFPLGTTFSGTVLDANGKPLREAGFKVSFTLKDNHGFGLNSVFTDGNGRFQLENCTPDVGVYSLEATAPGIMSETVKLNFNSQPQVIRLQRGRTLAGRVVEAGTGYPIPDMEVRALDYDSNKLPMVTTHTDGDGRFEFTTLGGVDYTLYADGGELLGRPQSGNLKFRADGRTNLTLTVKLYEWSNVKPKPPVAPAAGTKS